MSILLTFQNDNDDSDHNNDNDNSNLTKMLRDNGPESRIIHFGPLQPYHVVILGPLQPYHVVILVIIVKIVMVIAVERGGA